MKVQYLASRNKKIGSIVISWASSFETLSNIDKDKIPSHVAILINDKMVVESVLFGGVRIVPYKKWLEINEELYRVDCEQQKRSSEEVTDLLMNMWGRKYDWLAILYFAWSFFVHIFFDYDMPTSNPWQDPNKYMCTEYAGLLSGSNFSMKTPAKVFDDWLEG